jgi:hypothetical protein
MQSNLDEEIYLVEDPHKLNYLIYHNAWKHDSRSYGCILHVRIKNEKVYIEYDGIYFERDKFVKMYHETYAARLYPVNRSPVYS